MRSSTKLLNSFVYDLVLNNRRHTRDGYYLQVNDLFPSDKNQFLLNLLKYDDQGLVCLSENKNVEYIENFLQMVIRSPSDENKLLLANVILRNVEEYYEKKMQIMLDDMLEDCDLEAA